jgi:hypothetical protein
MEKQENWGWMVLALIVLGIVVLGTVYRCGAW